MWSRRISHPIPVIKEPRRRDPNTRHGSQYFRTIRLRHAKRTAKASQNISRSRLLFGARGIDGMLVLSAQDARLAKTIMLAQRGSTQEMASGSEHERLHGPSRLTISAQRSLANVDGICLGLTYDQTREQIM